MWITEKNAVFLKKKKKSNKMWITKTNLYTSKIAREKMLLTNLQDGYCESFYSYAQVMHKLCITSDFDVQKIKNPDLIRKYAGIA